MPRSLTVDEIGVQIEQPFDVLPLHGMARALTNDVRDELLWRPGDDGPIAH